MQLPCPEHKLPWQKLQACSLQEVLLAGGGCLQLLAAATCPDDCRHWTLLVLNPPVISNHV